LANYQVSFDLTRSRFEAGVANALDYNQAKATVEAARGRLLVTPPLWPRMRMP